MCDEVEVDATSLRTFRIGASSKAFQPEIQTWKEKHRGKRAPKYFLCHVRIAGCIERGDHGKVLLCDLPIIPLAPGSRPPTESLQDVRHSGFFDRLVKSSATRVHADGNRAWKSEAQRRKFCFSSVAHVKMQFTKRVYRKQLLSGTQKMDGFWKLLKRYVAP